MFCQPINSKPLDCLLCRWHQERSISEDLIAVQIQRLDMLGILQLISHQLQMSSLNNQEQNKSNFLSGHLQNENFNNYFASTRYLQSNLQFARFHSYLNVSTYHYQNVPYSQLHTLDEVKQKLISTNYSNKGQKQQTQAKNEVVVKEEEVKGEKVLEGKLKQKYGRNILSNIFHSMIKKIMSFQFRKTIERVIRVNRMIITLELFQNMLSKNTKEMKGYIKMKDIKNLQRGRTIGATKLEIQFCKLLRIVTRIYNNYYHLAHVFHTGKIRKQSRPLHLQCLRKLSQQLQK